MCALGVQIISHLSSCLTMGECGCSVPNIPDPISDLVQISSSPPLLPPLNPNCAHGADCLQRHLHPLPLPLPGTDPLIWKKRQNPSRQLEEISNPSADQGLLRPGPTFPNHTVGSLLVGDFIWCLRWTLLLSPRSDLTIPTAHEVASLCIPILQNVPRGSVRPRNLPQVVSPADGRAGAHKEVP